MTGGSREPARPRRDDAPAAGPVVRPLLIAGGLVAVAIGVVGIPLPVLPTTPFLLLAAWCFARSSERLHHWLVTHRRLSAYIVGFVYGGGVPRRAKVLALVLLWVSVSVSCAVIVWRLEGGAATVGLLAFLAVMAGAVSVFILTRPTAAEGPATHQGGTPPDGEGGVAARSGTPGDGEPRPARERPSDGAQEQSRHDGESP